MTGDDNPDNQTALLRVGANDLVHKPIEERLLITKLLFQLRVAACAPAPPRAAHRRQRLRRGVGRETRIRLEPSWKARVGDYLATPGHAGAVGVPARRARAGKAHLSAGRPQIFAALDATPFDAVKVVILGQDPYHGPGQAHGLCFSVPPGVAVPPSLHNIFKELERDLGIARPDHGCLLPWARQGVLLLNAVLTVERGPRRRAPGQGLGGLHRPRHRAR